MDCSNYDDADDDRYFVQFHANGSTGTVALKGALPPTAVNVQCKPFQPPVTEVTLTCSSCTDVQLQAVRHCCIALVCAWRCHL